MRTAPIMPLVPSLRHRQVIASKAAFTPASIAGLVAAWDFSDTAKITQSSGSVSQVDGAYGTSVALAQATGSLQPTTGTRTQNGLNILDFNSDFIVTSGFTRAAPWTLFIVASWDVDKAWSCLWTNTNGTEIFDFSSHINGYIINYTGTTTITATSPYLLEFVSDGVNLAGWVNGSVDRAANADTQPLTGFGLGRHKTDPDYYDGWVAEVLAYDSALSSTDRTTLRSYLNTKWAVY